MLIILSLVPVAVHFFKRQSFYNSSLYNGPILAISIFLLMHFNMDPTGTISTVVFVLFLIGPLILQKKINEAILTQDYSSAGFRAAVLKLISPFYPLADLQKLLQKLDGNYNELTPEELTAFKPKSLSALVAAAQLHFLKADWQCSTTWLNHFCEDDQQKIPWLTLLKLRVLCEENELEKAIKLAAEVRQKQTQYYYFLYHLIYLCAFTGSEKLLEKILTLKGSEIKNNNKEFWLAVCQFHSENLHEEGRQKLEDLSSCEELRIAQSSIRILQKEKPETAPELKAKVEVLSADLFTNLEDYIGPQKKTPYCTHILFLLNLAIFVMTRPGQNPNFPFNNLSEHLVLFLPESIDAGEWWRLLTTTFLHGNFLHFISNAIMILIFGFMVEPYFKAHKYLTIYLGAGIFGMLLVTFLQKPETLTITLGASGSAMALMGAYIAILLKQNRRSSIKLRKQQLIFLFIFIIIQSRIDYISPQISFTAHISGLVFGLITAYIFYKPLYTDPEKEIESISK